MSKVPATRDPVLKELRAMPWISRAIKHRYGGETWYLIENKRNVLERKIHSVVNPALDGDEEQNDSASENPGLTKLAKPYTVKMPRYRFLFRKRDDQTEPDNTRWRSCVQLLKKPKRGDLEGYFYVLPTGPSQYLREWKTYSDYCREGGWSKDFSRAHTPVAFAEMLALYLQTARMNIDTEDDLLSGKWARQHGLDKPNN